MLFLCRPHVCDEMKTRSSRDWQGPLQCSRWLQCTLESPAFSLSIKVRHSQPSLTSIPAERFRAACGCSCSTSPTGMLSSGPLDPLIPHVSALPVLALASLITSAPHFPRAPQKYSGFHKISSNRDTTDSWVSVSSLTASIDLSPRTLRDHPWPAARAAPGQPARAKILEFLASQVSAQSPWDSRVCDLRLEYCLSFIIPHSVSYTIT